MQFREERHHVLSVLDLVVSQVQVRQAGQQEQLMAGHCGTDDVSMEIDVLEVVKSSKTLNVRDGVLGEIESYQVLEVANILNPRNLVLLQEKHLQFGERLQSADMSDSIALQPNGLEVGVGIQIFNGPEPLVVQIEGVIENRSLILSIGLTEFLEIFKSDDVVAVFVFLHLHLLGAWSLSLINLGLEAWHCGATY